MFLTLLRLATLGMVLIQARLALGNFARLMDQYLSGGAHFDCTRRDGVWAAILSGTMVALNLFVFWSSGSWISAVSVCVSALTCAIMWHFLWDTRGVPVVNTDTVNFF